MTSSLLTYLKLNPELFISISARLGPPKVLTLLLSSCLSALLISMDDFLTKDATRGFFEGKISRQSRHSPGKS